jgi:hypothetical protein
MAKMQLGLDAEAVLWLRRSIEANRTFLPPIFGSLRPWACLAHRMRREPLRGPDLRSIQALPFAACSPRNRATIRVTLLDESASARRVAGVPEE